MNARVQANRAARRAARQPPERSAPPLQPTAPHRGVLLSRPGERSEREAERLAEAALRGPGRAHPSAAGAHGQRLAAPHIAAALRGLHGRGAPLADGLRRLFEPRLGHDFGGVRVHDDAHAAETARELGAVAFAAGKHVAFAAGCYRPETPTGLRLIAHELVHVAQQARSPGRLAQASYGTTGPSPRALRSQPERTSSVPPAGESEQLTEEAVPPAEEGTAPEEEPILVQRQTPPAAGAPGAGRTLATPTLTLTPGATLTRGDTLTVAVSFTPPAGESLTVTGWSYPTARGRAGAGGPAHETVNRPAGDPQFQSRWSGVMALSGAVVLAYRVTPAGGSPGPEQTISAEVTVNDRTGAPWAATVTLAGETASAEPSPPQRFRKLGLHTASAAPLPAPTPTKIAAGPNAQRTYVSSLSPGTFTSSPQIHPDLTNQASAFWSFHLNPSRLYLVPTSGARILIPLGEYSGLSVSGGTLSFTVPDWEAFYKAHKFYRVTADAGGPRGVVVPASNWRLDSNAEDAAIEVVNEAPVRARLRIPASQGFNITGTPRGTWEGYQLMQAPAILAGTQSHEYVHAIHSHRANFTAMMRALDPQRKIESEVAAPGAPVDFKRRISGWWTEIRRPDHELVDEKTSRTAGKFVQAAGMMAAVNEDPATGAFLGSVWNISADRQMT